MFRTGFGGERTSKGVRGMAVEPSGFLSACKPLTDIARCSVEYLEGGDNEGPNGAHNDCLLHFDGQIPQCGSGVGIDARCDGRFRNGIEEQRR